MSRKLRVLVVEDSAAAAKAIRSILERAGLEMVLAVNMEEFAAEVGKTNGHAFDAVILDLLLPDSPDPIETWRIATSHARYLPIIPMSSEIFSGVPPDSAVVKPDFAPLPDMIEAAVEAYSIRSLRSCIQSLHALVG